MTRSLVIVGAGLAGAKAAEAARGAGFDGRVVLVGDEPHAPYERPPLSKDVLRGDKDAASAQVHADGFYRDHDIELVADAVAAIDVVARRLDLGSGRSIGFDGAVLATGSRPRRLPVPGDGLNGVHYLRTVDDALALSGAIRGAIRGAGRVAVVGAGWIGSEVAASARQMGADVVLVDPAPSPLHALLGDRLGGVFSRLHADHGVELRLGTGLRALRGSGSVTGVELDNGDVEPADVVVVGIGVVPNVEIARAAGLAVDNGVVVDGHLQGSVPGVFAAGDVASAWHPHYQRHIRVEHWATALNQGLTAGRNAAAAAKGAERAGTGTGTEVYDRLPYFFSDQYDLGLEYVGRHDRDDHVVVRGDLEARQFIAFWQRDGLVTAAMNVNVWDVVDDLKALIASGARVDPASLADGDVALGDLSPAAAVG